ncbi:hypothetical protein AK38_4147 (plasmid) [Yersinia pestis CO92]|nr:hypothetical protein AK38_4147 [Yersinia pestis CO92]
MYPPTSLTRYELNSVAAGDSSLQVFGQSRRNAGRQMFFDFQFKEFSAFRNHAVAIDR